MQITRKHNGDLVEVVLAGRLDGYWCDHFDAALGEVLHDGNHHIRIDCSDVSYLTSAGIGVLVRFYKQLERINGTFRVVNPSTPVRTVLRIARLDVVLIGPEDDTATMPAIRRGTRRFEHSDVAFDVFDLDRQATLTCHSIGTAGPLLQGAFGEEHCASFESLTPTFAVGIGAFGGSFADCRHRFGELISVAGATAYQPGDGTNVADYLLTGGGLGGDIRVLYCLACEGRFSHLVRFDTRQAGTSVGLSKVIAGCLEAAASDALGVVIVAEASGLVGAALRRSPTAPIANGGFFAHPEVRGRLTFTTERAFPRSVVLTAGVAVRRNGRSSPVLEQLRPSGPDTDGHFHAAAFRFRPLARGAIDLGETVTTLFESEQLLGVLHLLHDDRPIGGAGESEFVRGACWVGPLHGLPASA